LTHPLQTEWYDADVEASFLSQIEALVHAGDLDVAAEKLLEAMEGIDTPLLEMCRNLSEDSVEISGWEEIGDAIVGYEGDPITAVHIVMSNEADLVFEDKSTRHDPLVEVAFYTDEQLAFSKLSRTELLTESLRDEPEWYGESEDIEVYLELNGLGALNTDLLRHKRQYYFRDSTHVLDAAEGMASDIVPLPYIEYRLAAMFRAVRYHQAVKSLLDEYGLYRDIPVIVGMFNMRLEIGSVYIPKTARIVEIAKAPKLAIKIKRNMEEEEVPEIVGSVLRQRVVSSEPDEEKMPGFFRRLFGRKAA
jgi:hypothetical protein